MLAPREDPMEPQYYQHSVERAVASIKAEAAKMEAEAERMARMWEEEEERERIWEEEEETGKRMGKKTEKKTGRRKKRKNEVQAVQERGDAE